MRAVLDTNVVVSGVFFGGIPRAVLETWSEGGFELCLSPAIFDEYSRVCDRLSESHPGIEYRGLLATLVGRGTLVSDPTSTQHITADRDDDKFMLCARQTKAVVVSGDKHLLDASGWQDVHVVRPRAFLTLLTDEGG